MVNRLSLATRTQVINCLVEGDSIRSTERMCGVHRDTVMRLAVEVGQGCERIMKEKMRGLSCERLQVDEIWSYVGKHQRFLKPEDDRSKVGDLWTFVAIDPATKLVPAYHIGKRTKVHAMAFMADLSERLANRVQISSDALNSYVDAVERAFGSDVDYGQAVKFYEAEPIGPGRYSPPKVVRAERHVVAGNPDQKHISTSLVERQNLTMRMSMRQLMLSARRLRTIGPRSRCISRTTISCGCTGPRALRLLWRRAFLIGCGRWKNWLNKHRGDRYADLQGGEER